MLLPPRRYLRYLHLQRRIVLILPYWEENLWYCLMDESMWLASTNPKVMLNYLFPRRDEDLGLGKEFRPSERKLRLFACACCRFQWGLLNHDASKRAVVVAEKLADGCAEEYEVTTAQNDVDETNCRPYDSPEQNACHDAAYVLRGALVAAREVTGGAYRVSDRVQAGFLRDIVGNPWRPMFLRCEVTGNMVGTDTRPAGRPCACWACSPLGEVLSLAQVAYDKRLPDGFLDSTCLLILSDALEEAGCENVVILSHLRSPGLHARGCWAVDLILSKS